MSRIQPLTYSPRWSFDDVNVHSFQLLQRKKSSEHLFTIKTVGKTVFANVSNLRLKKATIVSLIVGTLGILFSFMNSTKALIVSKFSFLHDGNCRITAYRIDNYLYNTLFTTCRNYSTNSIIITKICLF